MPLEEILSTFDPITLAEMSSVKLMNRTDTKFVTTLHLLMRKFKLKLINSKQNGTKLKKLFLPKIQS